MIASREEVDDDRGPDPTRIAYLTQTTLSVDDTREVIERLIERFPAIVGPADQDICYATQNRQDAVKIIAASGRSSSSSARRTAPIPIAWSKWRRALGPARI